MIEYTFNKEPDFQISNFNHILGFVRLRFVFMENIYKDSEDVQGEFIVTIFDSLRSTVYNLMGLIDNTSVAIDGFFS